MTPIVADAPLVALSRWVLTFGEDEPAQDALFRVEGPDEDGYVWVYGADTSDPWGQNLGPQNQVAQLRS